MSLDWAPLICAIGVSFFLEQTFRGMFGSAVKSYPDPPWQSQPSMLLGFNVPRIDACCDWPCHCCSWACSTWSCQRTRMGTAMRAVAEDGEAAALMGIDVEQGGGVHLRCSVARWPGIGRMCSTHSSDKQGLFSDGVYARHQGVWRCRCLGGIGNIPGAMLGGFFLGMVESSSVLNALP